MSAPKVRPNVDVALLRQAAEKCRDAKPGMPTLEALRHLQACFGWETVLNLLARLDTVERDEDMLRELIATVRESIANYDRGAQVKAELALSEIEILVCDA